MSTEWSKGDARGGGGGGNRHFSLSSATYPQDNCPYSNKSKITIFSNCDNCQFCNHMWVWIKAFLENCVCIDLPYSLSKSVIAKATSRQAPGSQRLTKYGHSLERTKPVEGLSLEVLMLAVKSSDGAPSGLDRDRNIGSSCNGDNEVTASSPCEVKII